LAPPNESPNGNPSEKQPFKNFIQSLFSNGRDRSINTRDILQTIINLGLPFSQGHRRFLSVQLLAFYVGAWCVGLIWLILGNVDLWTWLLLLGSGGMLWLRSAYRLWFRKKRSDLAKSVATAASNSPMYEKGHIFALASLLAILLTTGAGYITSQSVLPSKVLMLVAELEQAIKGYNEAIAQTDVPVAFFNRGNALYQQGNFEAAVKDYTQAIALKPNYADAFYNRGLSLYQQGNFEAAVKDFNQAIALKPYFVAALSDRGNALYRQGKLEDAIKDYTQAIALKPDLALAFNGRGLTLYRRGKFEDAIKDYTQAIALKPDYWQAMYNIGLIQYERGKIDEAKMHWQQAVSLNEKATVPRFALAVTLYTQGDKVKGIALAKEALAIDKRYASLEYLKKQLWGSKLLADAAKLLAEL
jgi:tetratricopeptide (TPR) repeat protein